MKILHITPIQNCLQFDTLTMILNRKVKSQGVCEEEHIGVSRGGGGSGGPDPPFSWTPPFHL